MLVYRIETKSGTGVYTCGVVALYMNKRNIPDLHSHPCPWEDGLDPDIKCSALTKYHFGFESLEQLAEWFNCPNGRRAMSNRVIISVFEVEEYDVVKLNTQVMFKRPNYRIKALHVETFEEIDLPD